jgi:hypothetical protein
MQKHLLPINLIENTQNGKLKGDSVNYNFLTTYQEVGPTCPTTCWFHPQSVHFTERKELGLNACYTLKGQMARHVSKAKFANAVWDGNELNILRQDLGFKFLMHASGRKAIDGIRWSTGGDILHPDTGEVWDDFVDLIIDANDKALELGIPTIGFTATWRMPGAQRLRGHFHASCQSEADVLEAVAMGWTVAYAVPKGKVEEALAFFKLHGIDGCWCPEQAGKTDSCANCGICARYNSYVHKQHPLEPHFMRYRRKDRSINVPRSIVLVSH